MIDCLYEPFQKWGDMAGVWIIGDPHFGDDDVKSIYHERPSDEQLVKNINSKVGKDGCLIILGDVGDNLEYVQKLKGYKVLIMGNHDKGMSNYKRIQGKIGKYSSLEGLKNAIDSKYKNCIVHITKNTYDLIPGSASEYFTADLDNKLFDEVYAGPLFISPKIILSHEPININFALNIHGHNHNSGEIDIYHLNTCADVIDYKPISLNKIIKQGKLAPIKDIHRQYIEEAVKNAKR